MSKRFAVLGILGSILFAAGSAEPARAECNTTQNVTYLGRIQNEILVRKALLTEFEFENSNGGSSGRIPLQEERLRFAAANFWRSHYSYGNAGQQRLDPRLTEQMVSYPDGYSASRRLVNYAPLAQEPALLNQCSADLDALIQELNSFASIQDGLARSLASIESDVARWQIAIQTNRNVSEACTWPWTGLSQLNAVIQSTQNALDSLAGYLNYFRENFPTSSLSVFVPAQGGHRTLIQFSRVSTRFSPVIEETKKAIERAIYHGCLPSIRDAEIEPEVRRAFRDFGQTVLRSYDRRTQNEAVSDRKESGKSVENSPTSETVPAIDAIAAPAL